MRTRPLRLLVVSPFYSPGVGGSSRLIRDIVERHVGVGDRVDVLTFGLGPPAEYRAFDRHQRYRVCRVPERSLRGLPSVEMLARALQLTHRRRYDVLLCGAAYPTALIGYVAHRCTGTPYAVYAHGEDVAAAAGSALTSAALRRALRSAGAVLANSSFTAGEIAAIGVPSEHVEVVHPWIDLAPFQQVDGQRVEALGQRLGLAGHRVVLTTARLDERKGHDVVIRALPAIVQAIPNALYLVVGKGDSTGLQALAERLGVGDCVRFVEYMAEDDLAALYGLCDVFVMVSRRDEVSGLVEGFGMVYLEAGAVGKPVVAGTHGGCADAVVDGVSGLVVDPTAPEQVARAVVRILSDAELAAHMSQAGRERAATFAKPKQVERVAAVLRGLARC